MGGEGRGGEEMRRRRVRYMDPGKVLICSLTVATRYIHM